MAVIQKEIPMVDPDHVFQALMGCDHMTRSNEEIIQSYIDCIKVNGWQAAPSLHQTLIDLLGSERANQVISQI